MTRHRTVHRSRGVLAALLCGALLLGACSSGDPSEAEDSPAAADEEPSAADDEEPDQSDPAEADPDQGDPAEDDAPQDAATIDPPLDLAGTTWVPTNYSYDPADTGITNLIGEDVFVELADDGTLRGYTGCNEFAGTWEVTGPYYDYDEGAEAFEDKTDGQPLSITAERTTDNECEGFFAEDDVNFLGALVATEIWWIGNDLGDQEGGITLDGEGARVYLDPA